MVAEIQFANGDMEAGAPIPTGWRKDWVGQGEIAVGRETQTVHGGQAALRVEATDARALAKSFVDVKNVNALTVSGWLKTAGKVKCSFGATPLDKAGKKLADSVQIGFVQGDATKWMLAQKSLDLPAGTRRIELAIFVEGTGQVWADDLKIEAVN